MRGIIVSCGRFGGVVRLADGRLASLPASDPQFENVRRRARVRPRAEAEFEVVEQTGRRFAVRFVGASAAPKAAAQPKPTVSAGALEQKIIDYLRQTADWDPGGDIAQRAENAALERAQRFKLAVRAREKRVEQKAARRNRR